MEIDIEPYYQPINIDRLVERFRQAARSAEKLERVRKIIDKACKKNSNGLPF